MDRKIAANYSSSSQKIRVMTESWVGCNILLENILKEGRIFIIKDKKEIPINEVVLKQERQVL